MNDLDSAAEFLSAAYSQLEFDRGGLLTAIRAPQADAGHEWLEKGDWQYLAAEVGAESIFFVDRDPVVVFAKAEDPSAEALGKLYSRIWCMSRPQLLFLAMPGELMLLDLTKPPPRANEDLEGRDRLIDRVRSIGEVQSRLAAYHRERIETGAVFGDDRFRNSLTRADRALIRDLKTVRQQLAELAVSGRKRPELSHLHALIGRAIFIRYLEDRKVLLPSYFENVAKGRKDWQKLLSQAPAAPALEPDLAELRFLRVLQDKEFTYALFDQLAQDFNGDTFPIDKEEQDRVRPEHLDMLRGFLLGSTSTQRELFFFAYRFDVIPIELISAIYEEFYNERKGKDRNQGSHYTPPALVDFVLAHTLTPNVLSARPRIVDPACGSGIFLVESYRRIVRHLWSEQNGRRLSRPQLRKILREQIAGMDINEEAVRVAAFSLYLAFLHYQEPREINEERRLPYLKWVPEEERERRESQRPGGQFFDVLLHANSFDAVAGKLSTEVTSRFGPSTAMVVVGNPPWGYPKKDDVEGHRAMKEIVKWCSPKQGRPIGDKELSQAFIHLTQALLQEGGKAGLLVSSGIFFKHHRNSRDFRGVWLTSACLNHVVNFAHVRQVFFSDPQREAKGISPFVSVVFQKASGGAPHDSRFQYWSAKRTAMIANTQCIVLNRGDMHWLSQRDCLANEKLWKIYWWGGHRDEALVRKLEFFRPLTELPKRVAGAKLKPGRGFEVTTKGTPAGWLTNYRELPAKLLSRYGKQSLKELRDVPSKVYRKGLEDIYHGHRLLVGRGIKGEGLITARFETRKYCFRNSVHGIRFQGLESWQEAVITAIFWSSLARYYYFTTTGSWGLWHDEIHLENVESMPICLPEEVKLRDRIVGIVQELQSLDPMPDGLALAGIQAQERITELESELDDAVFDLYRLSAGERDLVNEMCKVGLELFYRHQKSDALRELAPPAKYIGTLSDVSRASDGLPGYLRTFLEIWNKELAPEGELIWRLASPPSGAPLVGVWFETRYKNTPVTHFADDGAGVWRNLLARLDQSSRIPANSSRIFIDTFFRDVSEREILFIKRNERRFWTRTAAREDAESALTRLMSLEDLAQDGDR
jgi:hypothetical protein